MAGLVRKRFLSLAGCRACKNWQEGANKDHASYSKFFAQGESAGPKATTLCVYNVSLFLVACLLIWPRASSARCLQKKARGLEVGRPHDYPLLLLKCSTTFQPQFTRSDFVLKTKAHRLTRARSLMFLDLRVYRHTSRSTGLGLSDYGDSIYCNEWKW